jgi:hypothetical protein
VLSQHATLSSFKAVLQSVGYDSRFIANNYAFTDFESQRAIVNRVPLAAFSGYPHSYRNACLGVVFDNAQQNAATWVHRHRALGAPLIFEVRQQGVQPWSIGPEEARPVGPPFDINSLESVFRTHHAIWNPTALGRLKSASDAKPNPQLDFYDTGLMPVLAEFFQSKLKDLLERSFADTAACYRSVHGREPEVSFLFPYLFRFVTARIFMDRADARGWAGLDDPREILEKAETHSGSGLLARLPPTFLDRQVLAKAWASVSGTLHFQNLSVPDLALIYEDLFIDEKTRRELSVHSTPVGLADYVVEHLPWEKLPVNQRTVFEPFCGHGIFLARAMERLRVDVDPKLTPKQRHAYFQKMLVGVEKDPLAIEVCRLVLTLSDYPNHNSWQLYHSDVFGWPEWDAMLKSASVVLANPPYQPFTADDRKRVGATKAQPPAEFLRRLMRQPPMMLGLVLPQSFLSSPSYQDANRQIAQRYADVSIVELPKLFKYADNETVAVLASERRESGKHVAVRYAEVLPGKTEEFLEDFKVSAERTAKLDVSTAAREFTLWIPPKGSIFERLADNQSLGEIADIHRGLHWKARTDGRPQTSPRNDAAADEPRDGFCLGAEKVAGNLAQFCIKKFRYLSILERHHSPRDAAWKLPWHKPKVVCNRLRFVRKSPWRLASWADESGFAFSTQYFVLWPTDGVSEFALSAILSSPVANSFCFMHDLDRQNRIATLDRLPVPSVALLNRSSSLHAGGKRLQELLRSRDFGDDKESPEIIEALIRLDAAVLEAYDLPARLQRQLLNQFQGWKRPVAVPFTGYFPDHFNDALTLKDFLAIQYDWDTTNERRCDLIDKELSNTGLTPEEREELDHLQHLADLLVRLKEPYPLEELGGLVAKLKANGKWRAST